MQVWIWDECWNCKQHLPEFSQMTGERQISTLKNHHCIRWNYMRLFAWGTRRGSHLWGFTVFIPDLEGFLLTLCFLTDFSDPSQHFLRKLHRRWKCHGYKCSKSWYSWNLHNRNISGKLRPRSMICSFQLRWAVHGVSGGHFLKRCFWSFEVLLIGSSFGMLWVVRTSFLDSTEQKILYMVCKNCLRGLKSFVREYSFFWGFQYVL